MSVKCSECGSGNIFYDAKKDEYECLSCGYKWGRAFGQPKTEEERKPTHKERYGTEELPPRGTGLKQNQALCSIETWKLYESILNRTPHARLRPEVEAEQVEDDLEIIERNIRKVEASCGVSLPKSHAQVTEARKWLERKDLNMVDLLLSRLASNIRGEIVDQLE